MNIGKPTGAQVRQLRLHVSYIEGWLQRNRVTWGQVARRVQCWKTAEGKVAITIPEIEDLIGVEDPVAWAWLNLIEKETLILDGVEVVKAGDPWSLFPIQGKLARERRDLLVECGSEVGKTRDIVLNVLWRADTRLGPGSAMIGGDSDQTLIPIWEEIEFQLENNPRIGGGLVEEKCHIKPNRKKVFRNGAEIELRLAGYDGKNFRGGHFSDGIYGDECVKWKSRKQWSEFWRAGKPGSFARIYSTPDGDYSCPFYAMSTRAVPPDGTKAPQLSDEEQRKLAPKAKNERRLVKFHISKRELPAPFWSERRAAELADRYGGEHTVEWITNVEGGWGSPSYSVFPMHTLEPCLRLLPDYAIVTALIDRQNKTVAVSAARLNPGIADVSDTATSEEQLFHETLPFESGAALGRTIARYFPDVRRWISPRLFGGGDLGSASEPSEFVFAIAAGKKWTDVFRLHLRDADWPVQADIFVALDHASGHRVVYSLDNGSAGSALIQGLTQGERHANCPECAEVIYLAERLSGRGFGESVDDIDLETGEPILNPDRKDDAGNLVPYRVSNKEFSTRILERKMEAAELEIALDAGAGDQRLSGPQLMVNHTSSGKNKKGERNFRAVDDHHVDARRQLALAIIAGVRSDGFVAPDPAWVTAAGPPRAAYLEDVDSVRGEFGGERMDLDFVD